MTNELKIKEYCNKLGYGYRYFGDNAIITTSVDTWMLKFQQKIINKQIEEVILVGHQNKSGNSKRKHQFHTQRYARDLDYVFTNIISSHQEYNRAFEKTFRLKELLKTCI